MQRWQKNSFKCYSNISIVSNTLSEILSVRRSSSIGRSHFFEKYVRTGENSAFVKACVETNECGALHLHGFVWLDANVHLPTLLDDVAKPENENYGELGCKYIDSVFSEVSESSGPYFSEANYAQSCDEQEAKTYRRWESVFKYRPELVEDPGRLDDIFDKGIPMQSSQLRANLCEV
jgi:hypothetical protein